MFHHSVQEVLFVARAPCHWPLKGQNGWYLIEMVGIERIPTDGATRCEDEV
jgi:hypothetical protein